jgi:intracellular multiplication protein IcmC
MKKIKSALMGLVLLSSMLLTGCEGTYPSIDQMVINVADTMPSLISLTTALSYIMGFVMIMRSVYRFKEYGDLRTMMSSQTSIWPPIMIMVVGGLLLFLPSTIDVGLTTLFGSSSILQYQDTSGGMDTAAMTSALLLIMEFIGIIAFMRGVMLMQNVGQQGAQPGQLTKGVTFIIGGVMSINTYGTWKVLSNTFLGT